MGYGKPNPPILTFRRRRLAARCAPVSQFRRGHMNREQRRFLAAQARHQGLLRHAKDAFIRTKPKCAPRILEDGMNPRAGQTIGRRPTVDLVIGDAKEAASTRAHPHHTGRLAMQRLHEWMPKAFKFLHLAVTIAKEASASCSDPQFSSPAFGNSAHFDIAPQWKCIYFVPALADQVAFRSEPKIARLILEHNGNRFAFHNGLELGFESPVFQPKKPAKCSHP